MKHLSQFFFLNRKLINQFVSSHNSFLFILDTIVIIIPSSMEIIKNLVVIIASQSL